jgi:hypothetical protein
MMKMINRRFIGGVISLLLFVAVTFLFIIRSRQYSVSVYKTHDGWGYDVVYNHKIIIHQPYMPVVPGKVAFRDKSSARKTGSLVAKKLRNKKSPGITEIELKSVTGETVESLCYEEDFIP